MAVIVRKKLLMGGSEVEMRTYQPPGRLSQSDRIRADKLDSLLQLRIPAIAKEVENGTKNNRDILLRWYTLGKKLREIVDDRAFVSSADLSTGIIWEAIWHHLPNSLKPKGESNTGRPYSEKRHKRKDHLSLCYEISAFDWGDVDWVKGWDDWQQLTFRPGILRDRRIFRTLRETVLDLPRYPSRKEFREIVKILGKAFPTLKHKDSRFLSDVDITRIVRDAVARAMDGKATQLNS